MSGKAKIVVLAGITAALAALWFISRRRRFDSARRLESLTIPLTAPIKYCGDINLRSKLRKLYEKYDKDTSESWVLSNDPLAAQNSGLSVVLYGNPFYWTVFYNNSWIKFDAFSLSNEVEDIFTRRPSREESEPLLLPVGVPINFYIYSCGIPPLQSLKFRDTLTQAEIKQTLPKSASPVLQLCIQLDQVGQIIYSKTLVELRQADLSRRQLQMQNPVPPFVAVDGMDSLRILDLDDPTHLEALEGAKRLRSVVMLSATFKVVPEDLFDRWARQNQLEQLEMI